MKRFTLTVPLTDNKGYMLLSVHEHVRDVLTEQFGGFTSHDAVGEWFGKYEPNVVYTVDADGFGDHKPEDIIRGLAEFVKLRAQQDSVYMTVQDITRYAV